MNGSEERETNQYIYGLSHVQGEELQNRGQDWALQISGIGRKCKCKKEAKEKASDRQTKLVDRSIDARFDVS